MIDERLLAFRKKIDQFVEIIRSAIEGVFKFAEMLLVVAAFSFAAYISNDKSMQVFATTLLLLMIIVISFSIVELVFKLLDRMNSIRFQTVIILLTVVASPLFGLFVANRVDDVTSAFLYSLLTSMKATNSVNE